MKKFQIGDVVKLSSSTLLMTIASEVSGDGYVYCVWMDENMLPVEKEFLAATLEFIRHKNE